MRGSLVAVSFVGMYFAASQLTAQDSGTGWIEGTVRDAFGKPLGAVVDIYDNNGEAEKEVTASAA